MSNSLLNIADGHQPTTPAGLPFVYSDLGFNIQLVVSSQQANPDRLAAQQYCEMAINQNKFNWWFCLSEEEFRALQQPGAATMDYGLNVINAVPGSTRMPRFDKMLAQQTPTLSVLTQAFHQSEGHVRTGSPNRAIILSFEECNIQSPFRMGNSAVNTFCRGYQYPQQQVEMDRTLRFNMKEMQSQQIWLCTTVDPNSTLVQQAFQLNWNRDCGWSFNIPFNLAEMMMRSNTTTDQHEADTIRFQVISIMEYSGTQLIQQVSTEVATWLTTMLTGLQQRQIEHATRALPWLQNIGTASWGTSTWRMAQGDQHSRGDLNIPG